MPKKTASTSKISPKTVTKAKAPGKAAGPKKTAAKAKAQTLVASEKRQLRSRPAKASKPKAAKVKAAKVKAAKVKVPKARGGNKKKEEEIAMESLSSEAEEEEKPAYSPRVCEGCGSDIPPADEFCGCLHLCLVCGHSLPADREDPVNNRYCPECDSEASFSDEEEKEENAMELDEEEQAPRTPPVEEPEDLPLVPPAPVKAGQPPFLFKELEMKPLVLPPMEKLEPTQPAPPVLPSFDEVEDAMKNHPALLKWTALAKAAEAEQD